MTAFETVTERLAQVTDYDPGGNGHRSYRCPAHEDDTPSLSVTDGGDRVLVKCMAGCDTERVLEALRLTKADLFDEPKVSDKPTIVATYDYVDASGSLLYQVVRLSPKTFRQRRPDGNGWTWNLQGVERALYRLPEVTAAVANGTAIFVTEGEKDAEALERLGEVATCNAGGAGKWKPCYAETLAGAAHVVIVADRDQPGYRHARDVAGSLAGKVARLEVVHALDGKDAADHLAAGHAPEDFEVITDELDQLCTDPEGDQELPPGPAHPDLATWCPQVDWPTFWATDGLAREWLIEPIVPTGRQVAIFSRAKVGKSLAALDVASALATGRPVLGARPVAPVDVVYIDLEMTEDDIRERLADLGYGPDVDMSRLHYYLLPSLPPLDSDLGGQVVEAIAISHGAVLVVIDTMARAVKGEENSSDTYRGFYQHTGRRLKAAQIALLRLDHGGKDVTAGQRGSSAKADDVDVVFQLTGDGDLFNLKRTHSRIPWVPAEVQISRQSQPTLRHVIASGLWPEGTKEVARILDDHDVDLDASATTASQVLNVAGQGRRKQVVLAALKWRRERTP